MIQTSDSIVEISAALAKAQGEIENVAKDRENPHFRAKYATLAGVLDEARPKFAKNGISILQMPVNGEGSNVGVTTRLLHSSGQWIESTLFVAPNKFDAQGVGSALTYLRRYALMAMAGIAPEDDDGNAAVSRPEPQRSGMVRAPDVPPRKHVQEAWGNPTAEEKARQNGNGTVLPASAEEPPEMRLKRVAVQLATSLSKAPTDDAADLLMEDARDDLAAIERVENKIFKFQDGLWGGVETAKRLRTQYNKRIAEIRMSAAGALD